MMPDPRFLGQTRTFWANVRIIGQQCGYTARSKGVIKVPTPEEMVRAMESVGLHGGHVLGRGGAPTPLGQRLCHCFRYRAQVLNEFVEPRLMDAAKARRTFRQLKSRYWKACPLPMNKQKGEKRAEAYLTCIVNILVEANTEGLPCDYDPQALTTITSGGAPLRALARRIDGAFPSVIDPIAVWEVKEYYYTTTFGSRVADGVYETLLDGMELEEIRAAEGVDVKHYLIVDSHYTWWRCGKSYLCRIIDMPHMGYVDEVLFGSEVVERLPELAKTWAEEARKRRL